MKINNNNSNFINLNDEKNIKIPKVIKQENKNFEKEDQLIFVKNLNKIEYKNRIQNNNEFYKNDRKEKINSNNKISRDNHKIETFEKVIKSSTSTKEMIKAEENYSLIPTDKLENLIFLLKEFPNLFIKNTKICYRIYEISEITGELRVSDYYFGAINEYIQESKNFLIQLDNPNNCKKENM